MNKYEERFYNCFVHFGNPGDFLVIDKRLINDAIAVKVALEISSSSFNNVLCVRTGSVAPARARLRPDASYALYTIAIKRGKKSFWRAKRALLRVAAGSAAVFGLGHSD